MYNLPKYKYQNITVNENVIITVFERLRVKVKKRQISNGRAEKTVRLAILALYFFGV